MAIDLELEFVLGAIVDDYILGHSCSPLLSIPLNGSTAPCNPTAAPFLPRSPHHIDCKPLPLKPSPVHGCTGSVMPPA
jgi:hypothetical protein